MKKKLSPYTIASNCTDIRDCNDGLTELYDAYNRYLKEGKKTPAYIWTRIEKLEAKRDKCSLKEHGMKYDEYLLSLDLGKTDNLQGIDDYKIINDIFNARLQDQIDGKLPKNYVYQIGTPSECLLQAGIENLPIELVSSRLNDKAMQKNHPFDLIEVKNLPLSIQYPLAVFISATEVGSFVIFTELQHNNQCFVVAIKVSTIRNSIVINSIRSVHYRTKMNILNWITENLATYFCDDFIERWIEPTKKELLSKPQCNSVDVRKQLYSATNIVKDFLQTNNSQENLGTYVSNFVNDLKKANEKLKNAQRIEKIASSLKVGDNVDIYDSELNSFRSYTVREIKGNQISFCSVSQYLPNLIIDRKYLFDWIKNGHFVITSSKPDNDDLKQKLNLLKDFFRGRKKVRINSNPPEIGKSPIHAFSYPTGTMYADVRFEQFSEGNGWDYLNLCFVFNDPNYSGGITVYCDALPEYKEFVKTKKSFVDGTPTFSFSKHLSELYSKGEKLDWLKAKKIAKDFNIETETEIMQACELAVVLTAREIAQNGNSIRQQYEEMKDLYERQVTIRPLDTKSRVLQQYSTPCPLGYLLGRFVNKNDKFWNGKILEPSAGNGLLTIAFPPQQVCVNELDEIRVANLKNLGFSSVTNKNASNDLELAIFPDKSFRGVITNPPFAKLTEKDKIERHGWQINTLDYKMAVLALDKMHNDGKAAVIVGGKLWNAYWKPLSERSEKKVLFGQWKTFLGYLYAQYNVVDVVYIDGDYIYQKQGTSYPIVIILIDGRNDYDEANKPRYVFDPNQDTIINTFDQLFDRINPFLEAKAQDEDSERKRKLLILAQAKIRIAKAKNNN